MNCQAPMSFQWTREGGSLPVGRSQDNGFGLLLLTSVEEDDSGVYVCTVTAGIYSVQEKLELEVKDDRPETTTTTTTTTSSPEYYHHRYSPYRPRDEDSSYYYAHQHPETQHRQPHQGVYSDQRHHTADICPGLDVRLYCYGAYDSGNITFGAESLPADRLWPRASPWSSSVWSRGRSATSAL